MAHTVSVQEVMSSDYLGVHEGEPVGEVAALLAEQREDTVVVLDGRAPVGISMAVDLLDVLLEGDVEAPIGSFMREPVTTITPDATIEHAVGQLLAVETERLVVVDLEDNAVGVVDAAALLNAADAMLEEHLAATVPATGERSPPSISEQGVCESCGRLSDTLHESNGSLVCAACVDL